jgi:hypothetical protein
MATPFVEAIPARFLARLHHPGGSGNGCYWGSAPRSAHAGSRKVAVKWFLAFLCVPVLHPASRVSRPTALQRSMDDPTSTSYYLIVNKNMAMARSVYVMLMLFAGAFSAAYVQAPCLFVDDLSWVAAV